jgi:hypothetical protein
MRGSPMQFLMGFIALLIIVLVLTKLRQHRELIAFLAFAVLTMAVGIVAGLLR